MKNKGRVVFYLIVTIIIIGLLSINSISPKICGFLGKAFYNKNDFNNASKYYCLATKLDRINYDYSYYCVKSLANLPLTYQVQRDLYDMSLQNQAGAGKNLAESIIKKYQRELNKLYTPNYINYVLQSGKIIRWDISSFPLRIYFVSNKVDVPDYFEKSIKKAFTTWESVSDGMFSFIEVNNATEADIIVDYNPQNDSLVNECINNSCFLSIATTTPVYELQKLKRMNIDFNVFDSKNNQLPQEQVYRTALHEIGHALGLMGHSKNSADLMYMSDKSYLYPSDIITTADLNTIKLLYALGADISNVSESAKDNEIYSPIILGAKKQLNMGAFELATSYVTKAPHNSGSWVELANAYFDMKEYAKAIKALEKALVYARNNKDKYNIYFNMAIIYNAAEDYQNALKSINTAKSYDSDVSLIVLESQVYNNLGDIKNAILFLEVAYDNFPDNAEIINNLCILYIKNYKYLPAIKFLSIVNKKNPEILDNEEFNDKRIFVNIAKLF